MIQDYFPEVRGIEYPAQQTTSHQDISLPFQNTGDKERFREGEKVTRDKKLKGFRCLKHNDES